MGKDPSEKSRDSFVRRAQVQPDEVDASSTSTSSAAPTPRPTESLKKSGDDVSEKTEKPSGAHRSGRDFSFARTEKPEKDAKAFTSSAPPPKSEDVPMETTDARRAESGRDFSFVKVLPPLSPIIHKNVLPRLNNDIAMDSVADEAAPKETQNPVDAVATASSSSTLPQSEEIQKFNQENKDPLYDKMSDEKEKARKDEEEQWELISPEFSAIMLPKIQELALRPKKISSDQELEDANGLSSEYLYRNPSPPPEEENAQRGDSPCPSALADEELDERFKKLAREKGLNKKAQEYSPCSPTFSPRKDCSSSSPAYSPRREEEESWKQPGEDNRQMVYSSSYPANSPTPQDYSPSSPMFAPRQPRAQRVHRRMDFQKPYKHNEPVEWTERPEKIARSQAYVDPLRDRKLTQRDVNAVRPPGHPDDINYEFDEDWFMRYSNRRYKAETDVGAEADALIEAAHQHNNALRAQKSQPHIQFIREGQMDFEDYDEDFKVRQETARNASSRRCAPSSPHYSPRSPGYFPSSPPQVDADHQDLFPRADPHDDESPRDF